MLLMVIVTRCMGVGCARWNANNKCGGASVSFQQMGIKIKTILASVIVT